MMVQRQQRQDQQSKAFYELSALVLNILRSPPPQISFSDASPVIPPVSAAASSSRRSVAQITPGGFASLLLGISLAMMFCGSITFFIGFFLMPWVLGLVIFLYVAGVVSCISMLGRSVLCYATGPPPCPRKEIPSWKLH